MEYDAQIKGIDKTIEFFLRIQDGKAFNSDYLTPVCGIPGRCNENMQMTGCPLNEICDSDDSPLKVWDDQFLSKSEARYISTISALESTKSLVEKIREVREKLVDRNRRYDFGDIFELVDNEGRTHSKHQLISMIVENQAYINMISLDNKQIWKTLFVPIDNFLRITQKDIDKLTDMVTSNFVYSRKGN